MRRGPGRMGMLVVRWEASDVAGEGMRRHGQMLMPMDMRHAGPVPVQVDMPQ